MLVGSGDEAKVYLNGRQAYEFPTDRSFVVDEDTVSDITLNAGLNVLVLKVAKEGGVLFGWGERRSDWKGSIRLTDAEGKSLKGISVTLAP